MTIREMYKLNRCAHNSPHCLPQTTVSNTDEAATLQIATLLTKQTANVGPLPSVSLILTILSVSLILTILFLQVYHPEKIIIASCF